MGLTKEVITIVYKLMRYVGYYKKLDINENMADCIRVLLITNTEIPLQQDEVFIYCDSLSVAEYQQLMEVASEFGIQRKQFECCAGMLCMIKDIMDLDAMILQQE